MNTYEQALTRFINTTLDAAEKVGDFAAAELPLLVQEALNWYFAYYLITFVCGIVLAIVLLIADYKVFKAAREMDKENNDPGATILGWGLIGSFIRFPIWGIGVGSLVNLQWLKIWIAPKLWLIEFAARTLGGK